MSDENNQQPSVVADLTKTGKDGATELKSVVLSLEQKAAEAKDKTIAELKAVYEKLAEEKSNMESDLKTALQRAEEEATSLEAELENTKSRLQVAEDERFHTLQTELSAAEARVKAKYTAVLATLSENFHNDKQISEAEISALKSRVSFLEATMKEAVKSLGKSIDDKAKEARDKLLGMLNLQVRE